jgi:hypothetical protein
MFSGVPLSSKDLLAMGHLTESTTDPGIRDENIKIFFNEGLSS